VKSLKIVLASPEHLYSFQTWKALGSEQRTFSGSVKLTVKTYDKSKIDNVDKVRLIMLTAKRTAS
jgi:hypothetical protein